MRSCVVVVAYKAPVPVEQVGLRLVRLVERLYLANSSGPALASGDMFNSQLLTVQRKFRRFTSCRLELRPLISKYLFWNAKAPDGLFKQQYGVLSCWFPDLD